MLTGTTFFMTILHTLRIIVGLNVTASIIITRPKHDVTGTGSMIGLDPENHITTVGTIDPFREWGRFIRITHNLSSSCNLKHRPPMRGVRDA